MSQQVLYPQKQGTGERVAIGLPSEGQIERLALIVLAAKFPGGLDCRQVSTSGRGVGILSSVTSSSASRSQDSSRLTRWSECGLDTGPMRESLQALWVQGEVAELDARLIWTVPATSR